MAPDWEISARFPADGVCAEKLAPIAAFPAHWAPNAMVFYGAAEFPARYRNGVFIAFHGSWDRAPYPQQGYNVVFQSLSEEYAGTSCEIFADGFAGAITELFHDRALHARMCLAAREYAQSASWDAVFQGVYKTYCEMLAKSGLGVRSEDDPLLAGFER